jgi:hypothetical protein
MEEVVATYKRKFKESVKKLESDWKTYNGLVFSEERTDFYPVNIADQVKELRKRLKGPAKGIKVETDTKMSHVSIRDVVLRGVHRTPPANDKGEELRDVILWLYVLEIAHEHGEQVAFISDDSGFWNRKDRDQPDAQIVDDIKSKEVNVRVYRSLNAFIADHSLEVDPVTETWVLETLGAEGLAKLLEESVAKLTERPTGYRMQSFRGGTNEITKRQLASGLLYKVDESTQFAELEFDMEIVHTEPTRNLAQEFKMQGDILTAFGTATPYGGLLGVQAPLGQFATPYIMPRQLIYPAQVEPVSETSYLTGNSYLISAKATLFLRIKGKQVTEREAHSLVITKTQYLSVLRPIE